MTQQTDQDLNQYGPSEPAPWRSIDWATHQHWQLINDRKVNVIEIGNGPTVLLIHGIMGRWQHWLTVIPELAKNYRVITFDLPGFGFSEMPNERISMELYADTAKQLLTNLGVTDPARIVASSMGGEVGIELAVEHPETVKQLALVSPAGISTFNKGYRRYSPGVISGKAGQILGGLPQMRFDMVVRRPSLIKVALGLAIRYPDKLPKELTYELLEGAGKPGYDDALSALCSYDARQKLPLIQCPTLVVWGDTDRIIPTRDLDVLGELIPNVKTRLYPETGHGPMIERPVRFNADLLDFFNSAA